MDTADLYGLAFGCPYCDEKDDCPLKELRKLNDFEKQYEIIENMSKEQKISIISYHRLCRIKQNELRKVDNQKIDNSTKND